MTATELLTELETVTHGERMRRIVRLGQQARTDAGAQEILQTLSRGGFYERYLALMACAGSGNGAHVVQALSDPSRTLRGLALKLVTTACTDEEVQTALNGLSEKLQVVLLRDLLRHKRRAAIDAFLTQFAQTPVPDTETQLGQLLPFGSADLVRGYLARVTPRYGATDWARLARLHPEIAVETLMEKARALTEADARVYYQVVAALPLVVRKHPEAALELLRELRRVQSLTGRELFQLAVRCPAEVADFVLSSSDDLRSVQLGHGASRLSTGQVVALLEKRPQTLSGHGQWLRRVSPQVRRAAYNVAGTGWRLSDGSLDVRTVGLLPGDLRVAEARRCLALPTLATRPTQRLPYAAFLPWDEARDVVKASLSSPDPDLRSVALTALIGVARYDATRLPDVLALVRARSNEQDPIRGVMLTALAALPPSRWKAQHLDDIGQIVQDALDAADLSPATALAGEKWLLGVLPFHADWAAGWIARLMQARGQVYGLANTPLTDYLARTLAQALLPLLEKWQSRERETALVQVLTAFKTHLHVFTGSAPILERIARDTRNSYTAANVLALLSEHFPARFKLLVPSLLESDPSVGTLQPIYQYLHRTRQDLLTPYLGQTAFKGRFSTGKTRWVLPVGSHFRRWTARQQEIWATTLGEITDDTARDVPTVISALNRLALLPAVGPERVIALAQVGETRPAVRDAALRALAHFDAGQGIPTLLDALNDRRARIAIYALRGAILEMPPGTALALLRQVPTSKVTVAKEVVRLLGELETPEAFGLLRDMARQTEPPLHRDVRIAVLRGLWDHLDHAETWDVFNDAARDTDMSVARAVVSIPAERLSPDAQNRLRLLMEILLQYPDPTVRLSTLTRLATLPLSDAPRLLLPHLLTLLGSAYPDECRAAANAVFGTYTGADAIAVGGAIASIINNRRALQTALEALLAAVNRNQSRLLPTLRTVLAILGTDILTSRWIVHFAIVGLPVQEIAEFLEQRTLTIGFTPEVLNNAVVVMEHWQDRGDGNTIAPLAILESRLAQSTNPMLRRIALAALVAQSKMTPGWSQELRVRLEHYQTDPDPLVAEAAQFTFPPLEGEGEWSGNKGTR